MKKNLAYVAVIGLSIAVFWLMSRKDVDKVDSSSASSSEERATEIPDNPDAKEPGKRETIEHQSFGEVEHELIPAKDFDIARHPIVKAIESYARHVTPSTNVEIRSPEGRILYRADSANPFFGIKSIQAGRHVAINRGDGRYRVIDTATLETIDLPAIPDVARPIGFSWNWLNPTTLIGVAGIGYAESVQLQARCCDQHIVAASLLFLYDIKSRELQPVILPVSIKGSVFEIRSISQDGFIELVSASGHDDDGQAVICVNLML